MKVTNESMKIICFTSLLIFIILVKTYKNKQNIKKILEVMYITNEEVKMERNKWFISQIQKSLMPSTGCTEPIAIALNAAIARNEVKGEIKKAVLTVDPYLYKNAIGVGIPGCGRRGVKMCMAMGITCGNPQAGMNVLADTARDDQKKAEQLLDKIEVRVLQEGDVLFIQTELITECDRVRVVTLKEHNNIVDVAHEPYEPFCYRVESDEKKEIQKYGLDDFLEFAEKVSVDELEVLWEGLNMNRAISERGKGSGIGEYMCSLERKGYLGNSLVMKAHRMAGGGSYARMSGISMPVMTATGSGNQGITLFLPIDAAAVMMNASKEQELRALALAALVNILGKSYIGELSSVCACGVASGIGASLGICYMLGADRKQMLGAAKNILGTISGMICDGAKEECANKVAISSALAVEAAFLAMEGYISSGTSGILAEDLNSMYRNLGYFVHHGMESANRTMIQIMTGISETADKV